MTRSITINSRLLSSVSHKPRYEHDCNKCFYLGWLEEFDIYICGETILYRYGNERHEYGSREVSLMQSIYWTVGNLHNDGVQWNEFVFVLLRELIENKVLKMNIKIARSR